MKNIIINLINANQGAHLIRSYNFLKCLKELDNKNNYIILSENNLNISAINFKFKTFKLFKNKFLNFFQRFFIQNILINFYFFKYNIGVYLNFSHTIPLISLKKVNKIVAVTNVAPFVKFNKFSFFQKLKMYILKNKILYSCNNSNNVISISEFCKSLLEKNNINASKIKVIYNGIDTEKNIISKNKDDEFFLYISHFYKYKNFENLLIAYQNLPLDIKDKYKLKFIGHPYDISYYKKIHSLIDQFKLKKNVEILSNLKREEINWYLKNCELFIFPSLIENCPMSLLEAMQFDKPIITSHISPMDEFCKELPII